MSRKIRIRKPKEKKKNSDEQLTFAEFEGMRCAHCGGAHLRACPRVKRMIFHTSGALNEIEFWADGQWDKTNVAWPEEITNTGDTSE
jgi:hypothetical protein